MNCSFLWKKKENNEKKNTKSANTLNFNNIWKTQCVNYNENEALLFFIRTFNDNFKWTLEIFGSRYQMLFSLSLSHTLALSRNNDAHFSYCMRIYFSFKTMINIKLLYVCVCCALFLSFFPSVFFLKLGTAGKVTFKILICSWLFFLFSCSFWKIERNNTSSI